MEDFMVEILYVHLGTFNGLSLVSIKTSSLTLIFEIYDLYFKTGVVMFSLDTNMGES